MTPPANLRLGLCLLALAWPGLAWPSPAAAAPPFTIQSAVLLMRHGVRPPTKAEPLPAGEASQPWPAWDVDWGYLTAHGTQAVAKVGIHWATEQCRDLLDNNVRGIHFYTLNKSDATL